MSAETVYERIVDGWERTMTENQVPYYLNCKLRTSSWDHPFYLKIIEELDDFNCIRYAAYKTSMKLQHLQQRLSLDTVSAESIKAAFEKHGCPQKENLMLNSHDLMTVLTELFKTCHHANILETGKYLAVELVQNLLLNLYDRQRNGRVWSFSVKIALIALCGGNLEEKYQYFYDEICNASTFIDNNNLSSFLLTLMKLPDLLHEGMAFGGLNTGPALDSCLKLSGNNFGISQDGFYQWLYKEPQTVVWLPVLHRIMAAEKVKHKAKCSVCKEWPMVGLRYRCLICFRFDVCQRCFFTGRIKGRHKVKHPLQEYCSALTTKQETKAFLLTMRNNLRKKHRCKQKYLPVEGSPIRAGSLSSVEVTEVADGLGLCSLSHYQSVPKSESLSGGQPSGDISFTNSNSSDKVATKCSGLENHLVVASIHNRENSLPLASPTSHQVQELENIIRELQSENKCLYRQLEELKEPTTDSSCSGSIFDELEQEKELVEAKKEVVEDHNQRLNDRLSLVRNILKTNSAAIVDTCNLVAFENEELGQVTDPRNSEYCINGSTANTCKETSTSPHSSYCQEDSLEEFVQKLEKAFPQNMSYSAYSASETSGMADEMLRAAEGVGIAMSDMVNKVVPPQIIA